MDVPGWRLHSLERDLAGHRSVWANGNWRLTFAFEGQDGVLVDYQVNGRAAVSADLALRLADWHWLPPSAESWLRMQAAFDLRKASKKRRPKIKRASHAARAA